MKQINTLKAKKAKALAASKAKKVKQLDEATMKEVIIFFYTSKLSYSEHKNKHNFIM